jgi:hypothetical protein
MNTVIAREGTAFGLPCAGKTVFMGSGLRPAACPGMTMRFLARPASPADQLNKAKSGGGEAHGLNFTSRNAARAPSRLLPFD